VFVNDRHFRPRSRWMIARCYTALDPSLWISGVLNEVFVSGLFWLSRPTSSSTVVTFSSVSACCLSLSCLWSVVHVSRFLRATAGTAIARLSHRNSVRPSVCPSVTRVDQAKTVQARIIKSSPSAAPRTLVSGSVTIFQKFRRVHPNRGP